MTHDFQFTHDWFTGNIPIWQKHLSHLRDKPTRALEIGCFEGRATVWMLENLLVHPASAIDIIDTFSGSREHAEAGISFVDVRGRFDNNIKPWQRKVKAHQTTSLDGLVQLNDMHWTARRFNLIYIDGSHMAADVLTDACLAWPLLAKDGIFIFDDYLWGEPQHPEHFKPKPAVDAFLQCFATQYELLHSGYQVFVKRL